jgi:hypothetical protein
MVLFSRLRVNLAMSSHSAAKRKNFSAGSSMGSFLPVLVSCLKQQNQNPFEMFPIPNRIRRLGREGLGREAGRRNSRGAGAARARRPAQPQIAARLLIAYNWP